MSSPLPGAGSGVTRDLQIALEKPPEQGLCGTEKCRTGVASDDAELSHGTANRIWQVTGIPEPPPREGRVAGKRPLCCQQRQKCVTEQVVRTRAGNLACRSP